MAQNLPGMPVGKPIGFKTLQEITGYISVHDGNVLKVTVDIMKIIKTDQKDPQGMPIYNVANAVNMIAMTKEEYQATVGREPAE